MYGRFLTIHWSTGFVDHAVALHDAIGLLGLTPGHVDRGSGEFTEVNETGSTGSCGGNETL